MLTEDPVPKGVRGDPRSASRPGRVGRTRSARRPRVPASSAATPAKAGPIGAWWSQLSDATRVVVVVNGVAVAGIAALGAALTLVP